MSGLNRLCLPSLTAAQNTQLQLCSSLVAADGCSLRHSLQKTTGPLLGFAPASGVPGSESPASWLRVGLRLAMTERDVRRRDGWRNQAALNPSAGDCEDLQSPSMFLKAETALLHLSLLWNSFVLVTVHTTTVSLLWKPLMVNEIPTVMTSLHPEVTLSLLRYLEIKLVTVWS